MWYQPIKKMALRGARYITIIFALTACVLVFSYVILGINLANMPNPLQRKQIRKVDKHFFFEMLPSFDHTFRARGYQHSKTLASSEFSDVADRVLVSRYLSERFAYSSFVQIGCQRERVYQLLPESLVSTRLCVDEEVGSVLMTPQRFFNSTVVASRHFDMIMIEPKYLNAAVVDAALTHLTDGGVLILTDTNPVGTTIRIPSKDCKKLEVLLALRRRLDLDIATVDVDGGVSVVYGRRNSAMLDLSSEVTEQYLSSLSEKNMENVNKAAEPAASSSASGIERDRKQDVSHREKQEVSPPSDEAVQQASHHNDVILNLMRFEDVHDWLAATGNVDAVTAFGGNAALTAFREAEINQQKCSLYASDVTTQERALTCFQEAAASNRICLTSRWQMAMLLIQHNKLVDAVTALNQLQSLNAEWYKWMLGQFGAQTAQMFLEKTVPGSITREKRRSNENDILASVAHLGEKEKGKDKKSFLGSSRPHVIFGGGSLVDSQNNKSTSTATTTTAAAAKAVSPSTNLLPSSLPVASALAPAEPPVIIPPSSRAADSSFTQGGGSTQGSGSIASDASLSTGTVDAAGLGPMGGGGGFGGGGGGGGGRRGRKGGRRGPNMRGGNSRR